MAAAAYATVVSLMQVLDNIKHPSRQHLHFDRNQIETLREKVSFLLGFLEEYSEILCHTDTEDLARQIAYAVDDAEEVIDYHVVIQLCERSAYNVDMGLSSFREDMDIVLNKIESIKKELMMVKDQKRAVKEQPESKVSLPAAGSSASLSSSKINTMVGFDEHLVRIMDQLTGHESGLQIVPITGMGGIGKTTLARNIFENRCVVDRFDLREWITISQSYSIQDILLGLLGELDKKNKKENNPNIAELGEALHKMLFGRRYLIVMDDMWSTEVWDQLQSFLPDNRNGSRIVVTTRLSQVAISLGSQNPYLMDFLDEEKSWNLFCIKAFGKEICQNPELEKLGKNIIKYCKGLPLAIIVIGGLLGKSNMMREDWELVSKDVMKSLDNSEDEEDCLNILSLSYKHLPIHLKPCFLYMRMFPEDSEIDVYKLIDCWIAEGFIKPKRGISLEEVGREYLKDLIDRNLLLINRLEPLIGDIWECKVHDLLRDFSIKEYDKEHFFGISKVRMYLTRDTCFLCCYREASAMKKLPQGSCFVCDVCNIMWSHRHRLRVVKAAGTYSYGVCTEVIYVVTRLRYFAVDIDFKLESTVIPVLWNLQYLILEDHTIELPYEIWEMPQLRHLDANHALYVDPGKKDNTILENLHTLKVEINFKYSEEFLKRIPNVETLEITYKHSEEYVPLDHLFCNFADLCKLNFLICEGINLEHISFPKSLKILVL